MYPQWLLKVAVVGIVSLVVIAKASDVGALPFKLGVEEVAGGGNPYGWLDDGAVVRLNDIGDSVGIGTLTPVGKFHVAGGNAIFDGNVGIGTNVASAKLDVLGAVEVADDGATPDTKSYATFGVTRGAAAQNLSYLGLTKQGFVPWGIGISANDSLIFGTAAFNPVRTIPSPILSVAPWTSSVGVRTSSPLDTFDVQGSAVFRGPRPWADVRAYGAKGDGTTDDTAAIQTAINTASHVYIPEGTYRIIGSGITVPSSRTITFASNDVVLKYVGSQQAISIANAKNVTVIGGRIDLTAASVGARAFHVRGLWFGNFYHSSISMGGGTTGFFIETSATGGNNWGSYIIQILNPDIRGGEYGIRTIQTPGDSVEVTHLKIQGGWIIGNTYNVSLNHVANGLLENTAAEGAGIDSVYIEYSHDTVLMPGETSGGRYGLNFGPGNRNLFLAYVGLLSGGSGSMNTSVYTPSVFNRNQIRLYASRDSQAYFVDMSSIFNYGHPFSLLVSGDNPGDPTELLGAYHTGSNRATALMYGNVGIGTTSPNTKLQITGGDAAVTTSGKGLILRATDGPNCFRITVNNSGSFNTSIPVSCP